MELGVRCLVGTVMEAQLVATKLALYLVMASTLGVTMGYINGYINGWDSGVQTGESNVLMRNAGKCFLHEIKEIEGRR